MDKREMRFRAAADQVIRSNRKIRDKIRAVKPFYLGDESVPVPPLKSRLETVLNPKGNGACKCLDLLCSAAKEYRPSEYPTDILDLLNKTTLDLIHNEIEPIQRIDYHYFPLISRRFAGTLISVRQPFPGLLITLSSAPHIFLRRSVTLSMPT